MTSSARRLYIRPTAFVEAPFGYDGQCHRLAGGQVWFSGCEVIIAQGGKRVSRTLVPVDGIERFIEKLDAGLAARARLAMHNIVTPRASITLGERAFRFDETRIMGILNITPDSFSGDGRSVADPAAAADQGFAMGDAGAAIIDVGGESTRPGAATIWEGDEIARIEPAIRRLAATGVVVSVDTRKAAVMAVALDAGARIVNDVSALLYDPLSLELLASRDCPVVLMHHQGDPATMQSDPRYDDVLLDVYDWLEARIEAVVATGIARDRIIVDPGIGFGKTLRHNLQLLNGLALFHGLGCPILLGASRKRIIGALSNEAPVDQRLGGSVALALYGAQSGVQLLRVHDVFETAQALRTWRGLRDEALTPTG
jgi:dihydropteroate synthase